VVAASAADITMVSQTVADWQRVGNVDLYVIYSEPFTASDGTFIGSQSSSNLIIFKKVQCTIVGTTLTIPSFLTGAHRG
jgi:hypothetical protein